MSESTTNTPVYSKARVGMMLAAVLMLIIVSGFGNFKFVPMQTAILEYFNIGESSYGYLNTSAGWVSVILAVPFAFLVRKLRCNISVILGILVAVGGIFIQTMATSFAFMLIGRMIEGIGSHFATMVTGSLILNLTNRNRVALWSSIMIFCSIVPQVVMTKGGTALMVNSGLTFQTIFRIIAFVYLAALVIWVLLVPFSLKITGVGSQQKPTREQTIRVMKNKSNWLVALANIFFNVASITFTAYIIRFLTTKGMTQSEAANIYSYTTIIGLFSMIAFGFISDKLKTKRKIAIMSFFAGAGAYVLLGILPANLIIIYIVVWGTLPRSIAGMTQASASDIAELPADIPIVNSIKNTITQVGAIIMGILIGYAIQYLGYNITIYMVAGGMVIGGILWILAKRIP